MLWSPASAPLVMHVHIVYLGGGGEDREHTQAQGPVQSSASPGFLMAVVWHRAGPLAALGSPFCEAAWEASLCF